MGILNKITKKEEIGDDGEKGKVMKSKKSTPKTKKGVAEKMPSHYYDIIVRPHVSEKAFNLSNDNQHIFVVSAKANKSEIKKAVKSLYGVSVLSVNIINVPAKPKRFKGKAGVKSGYRKAIVKLAKNSKIDLMKESK
ncbi:50S ribosomal protein L23 [Candidatus Parcubacteria bacterium]|nr:50S ribosomal protein L23 [Candidatus Parcubacteria bacterium]